MTPGGPRIKLNSGAENPAIGLGTWQSKPGEVEAAVAYAIKEVGYRAIDCAWRMGTRKRLAREFVPLASLGWKSLLPAVEECLDQTLANLGINYHDCNHPVFPTLPNGKWDVDHAWFSGNKWRQWKGQINCKSIGDSNFSEAKLEEILPTAEVIPAVNQLKIHVYNPQHKLISYLKSKGIVPQAYSPLGSTNSPLLTDEVVTEVAIKHSLQPADILLGYLLAKGIVVLPKSVTPARISSNFTGALAAAEKLDAADVEKLDGRAASGKQKRFITPPWCTYHSSIIGDISES
ncbi:NADP-dependent oxidoreductase domain-containing protein [Flammula alnicola]|nr:NADP-dependent oxidoreductase domain-containing protein [Flammula alnicola]